MVTFRAEELPAGALPRFPLVDAAFSFPGAGEVFAGDGEGREWCLVLHRSGFGRFFSRGDRCAAFRDLLAFLPGEPRVPGYFHLYAASPEQARAVEASPLRPRVRRRIRLEHDGAGKPAPLAAGYRLADLAEVSAGALDAAGLAAWRAFWPSPDALAERGFGACALDAAGEPAAVCYAAAVERGVAEVDVLTRPEHRGRGLGGALAAAFVAAARERGVVAGWDCFADNLPSLRIARGAGFRKVAAYDFLSIYDPSKGGGTP